MLFLFFLFFFHLRQSESKLQFLNYYTWWHAYNLLYYTLTWCINTMLLILTCTDDNFLNTIVCLISESLKRAIVSCWSGALAPSVFTATLCTRNTLLTVTMCTWTPPCGKHWPTLSSGWEGKVKPNGVSESVLGLMTYKCHVILCGEILDWQSDIVIIITKLVICIIRKICSTKSCLERLF